MTNSNEKTGFFSRKILLGTSIGAAIVFMIAGVIFWGGFNTVMEATNTLTFCISCHEMEENVYQEYKKTVHYKNGSGVRATCSDCHVPDPWVHKFVRKIQASNELLHKALGSIDTPEKFNEKRLYLAKRVWTAMKATDSRECRNCHDFGTMEPEKQKGRARKQHLNAMINGNTCIDCHKGIAHSKAHDQLTDEELAEIEKPNSEHKRDIPPQWIEFSQGGVKKKSAVQSDENKQAAPAPAASTPSVSTGGDTSVDWSKIEPVNIGLLYPGQTSMEWILNGRDHGGARAFKAGDRCWDCHEEETEDMGTKMVTGEKAESTPIPGKRPGIPVQAKAAHDGTFLYMQFQWPDTAHVAVPFVDGGKMDPDNQVKLGVMLGTDDVEYVDRAGCWATCHHDARSMPHEPDAATRNGSDVAKRLDTKDSITKYLKESRTEIEVKGKGGKKRGGWNKLKSDDEIKSELTAGRFMDLLRYKSGGASEDGHILAERTMQGGQGVEFNGVLANGTWTVTMKRKLSSDKPGDISIAAGNLYNLSIAIHDDYTNARFHHVSLGYKLGLDNDEAELNAVKQ